MPYTVRVRPEAFDDAITTADLSVAGVTEAMSVTPEALNSVRGGQEPDPEFIAGALLAFAPLTFEDLFEVLAHPVST
ncbi:MULTISPECIES: transcriptional regulator [Actinosynnema]|uniref:transcriptional regulator n=1 Tax=Actinosynnema TaxID=40566 RepID=UPI0020A3C634|nr:transcriptional regulator [Actinosynnema pretiosum]MCP2098120.1 hypothetical protein [Actinosynnema pretiosum]